VLRVAADEEQVAVGEVEDDPAVMNEKEALLRSLQSADAKAISEDHKAEVLHAVSAPTSAKSQQISADEKLKVLQQLSAQY
jgi:hypothetical protein